MASKNSQKREDEEYQDLVVDLASKGQGPEQAAIYRLLQSEKARDIYRILQDERLPEKTIKNVMSHSLKNIQRGKGLTAGAYATAIAEELVHLEGYQDAIEDMYEEKLISERTYENAKYELDEGHKGRVRTLGGLERITRRVAAISFLLTGTIIALASETRITGAVIGTTKEPFISFLIGMFVFLIGIVLYPRK